MKKVKQEKFTIKQFNEMYPDDAACLHQIFLNRFGNEKECSKCKKSFSYHKVSERKCYACAFCGSQIHPLAGTIFHKSKTILKNWFFAIFLFSASKNGVSAKELERQLGVTYKCAYRIGQQIRKLFATGDLNLKGIVEVDETYCGGKEANKHKDKKIENTQGRSVKTKTPIIGIVERQGQIVAKVVSDTKSKTILEFVEKNVEKGSEINTDEYRAYARLSKKGYIHKIIEHSKKVYALKGVSTNSIEGFWSQLKRSINGTHHFVSPKCLQNYVNEFAFRYNLRKSSTPIFFNMINRIYVVL